MAIKNIIDLIIVTCFEALLHVFIVHSFYIISFPIIFITEPPKPVSSLECYYFTCNVKKMLFQDFIIDTKLQIQGRIKTSCATEPIRARIIW